MARPKKPVINSTGPRTPAELAEITLRKGFNLYLNVRNMEYLAKEAEKYGTSQSQLVDEAIASYIEAIKSRKNE